MTHSEIMCRLHGTDIYAGFAPTFAVDLQGWNSTCDIFREIVVAARPTVVIDVGVWKGASTIHLAELMRERETPGTVIAVDTFLGSVAQSLPGRRFFGLIPHQFGRPLLYEQFLSNVVRSNMQDIIVPLAQSSLGAAEMLGCARVHADVIHLDAAHDYTSVLADAHAFWAILRPGGYLIGDDYDPSWPGVVQAADEFSRTVGVDLRIAAPKWIMRKP